MDKFSGGVWVPIESMAADVAARVSVMGWKGSLKGDGWASWGSSEEAARASIRSVEARYQEHLAAVDARGGVRR